MSSLSAQLASDAERIWRAGIRATSPDVLIRQHIALTGSTLRVNDYEFDLNRFKRIYVVGAGKAAGAIAAELEGLFGSQLILEKRIAGLVNVPNNCVVPTRSIRLHGARPPEINEPTMASLRGTRKILQLVRSMRSDHLCICVVTGGASALLSAPARGITLGDKLRVTRLMSSAGANIEQLNTVRRNLSRVKNGGLVGACRAGQVISLIVSDIPGDQIDLIGSGPTATPSSDPNRALNILLSMQLPDGPSVRRVTNYLAVEAATLPVETTGTVEDRDLVTRASSTIPRVVNVVLANNASAVNGACAEAIRLGYRTTSESSTTPEGPAEVVGERLAEISHQMQSAAGGTCHVSGGETSVTLVEESRRGRGGRNQQLALAYFMKLRCCRGVAFLSAGTDGEDGPTNAAGAFVSEQTAIASNTLGLDPSSFLCRNDAYNFFRRVGGLFITGPTHTNVCDLRIVIAGTD